MVSPERIPALAPVVCFESKAGCTYLYNPEIQRYVLLDNQIGVDIVAMCDGQKTILDIVNAIVSRYEGAQPVTVLADVEKMLTVLDEQEFILLKNSEE